MAQSKIDVEGMHKGASLLTRPAEEYVNDETVENLWVQKACQHADVYYNLISTVNPQYLRLTENDDDRINDAYKRRFSEELNLSTLKEEDLKSEKQKTAWREFCEGFKDVEDYSFGTLLRLDPRYGYSEENTILVTRIQFLAIEIARNRLGLNNYIWQLSATKNVKEETDNGESQNTVEMKDEDCTGAHNSKSPDNCLTKTAFLSDSDDSIAEVAELLADHLAIVYNEEK